MTDPFLATVESTITHPSDPRQLQRAIVAHRLFLEWESDRTVKRWKVFVKFFWKIGVDEL